MLIQTRDRFEACEALINVWLKDKTKYCNNCNWNFDAALKEACCENPQLGTNFDHCYGLVRQNKEMQKTRENDFASNEDNTMRWGISIPPRLYQVLDQYYKGHGEKGLIRDQADFRKFMKKFPQFTIAKKV